MDCIDRSGSTAPRSPVGAAAAQAGAAVLADHPVLLLDEPTEHLDPPTAQAVLNTIAKVSRPVVGGRDPSADPVAR